MGKNLLSKISITALAIATTTGVIGSVAGTVAWFQYSTRAQAAYTGTSVHCTQNLLISLDGQNWKTELNSADTISYLINKQQRKDTALRPVTTGEHKKDEKIKGFKRNPIYQFAATEDWLDATYLEDYVTFPLYLKVTDSAGKNKSYNLEKNIYLSDLTIVNNPKEGKADISNAIRVHFDVNDLHATLAKDAFEVQTYGPLDLNGDNLDDLSKGYDFSDGRHILQYGLKNEVKGVVDEDDDDQLPAASLNNGDVYYFEKDNSYKQYDEENDVFKPLLCAAESYSNAIGDFVSDDSDPSNIVGNPIGKTLASVPELEELPNKDDVRKVSSLNKNYKWNGSAWEETNAATTKSAVSSVDDLRTATLNEICFADDTNKQYIYNGENWVVYADETVTALPDQLPAINDSYFIGENENRINYIWDGEEWLKGGEGSLGQVNALENLPGYGVYGKRYYNSSDDKYYSWSGNGDVWNEVNEHLNLLKVNVTIYLEGWQKLANKGTVAKVTDLANASTYIDTSKSYHIGEDEERVNYMWDENQLAWVEGGNGEDGKINYIRELPNLGDSFQVEEDGKIYVLKYENNAFAWAEGEGSAIWDDLKYVESSFNIGMRFTSEIHLNH